MLGKEKNRYLQKRNQHLKAIAELRSKIVNKVYQKLLSYEKKLNEKGKKSVILLLWIILLFGFGFVFYRYVESQQLHTNPFRELNTQVKQLARNKTIKKVGSDFSFLEIYKLLQLKSELEKISLDNLTPQDSLDLIRINKKIDTYYIKIRK